MQIPYIPEIVAFSEWMDLLTNMPACQERLKLLKEAQDLLNARIGDYELFTKLKGRQHEIQVSLADAKQIKAEAEAEVKKIKQDGFAEVENARAKLLGEKADFQRNAKDLSDLEGRVNAQNTANGILSVELEKKSRELNALEKAVGEREDAARRALELFKARQQKTLEIWQ